MIKAYKAEAIVLGRRSIGEADRIITVFTKQYGKKTVIAPGVRKIKSRKSAHLELFTHVLIMLAPGKNFDLVTEAQTIEAFTNIRFKLERISFAYIGLELIHKLTAEGQESYRIFEKLIEYLRLLNNPQSSRKLATSILKLFKQGVLEELGFISNHRQMSEENLDQTIEDILERKLKSPEWLTNIQTNL